MPQIKLHEEIVGDRAKTLAKIFPGVVKVSKKKGKKICNIFSISIFFPILFISPNNAFFTFYSPSQNIHYSAK